MSVELPPPGAGPAPYPSPDAVAPRDLVDVLAEHHAALVDLLDRARSTDSGPARHARQVDALQAVRRHMSVEEDLVHPVVRRWLPDGDRAVRRDVAEHETLESYVRKLSGERPGAPIAKAVLNALAEAVRLHLAWLEADRFPELRRHVPREELDELAARVHVALRGDVRARGR